MTTMTAVAKHTHGSNFGRKVEGCPRCTDLLAGAAPIAQPWRKARRFDTTDEDRRHFTGTRHLSGGCGPVCTYGEW